MTTDDWSAWQETGYLFASPVNARRLLDAAQALDEGRAFSDLLARNPGRLRPGGIASRLWLRRVGLASWARWGVSGSRCSP
ncbi:Antitoxin YefM [Mycobacteroides abscessus subsp. abscessus]|nr:Antitoxin YefM [Mycobacteroides abscessus subsp. abscessus]